MRKLKTLVADDSSIVRERFVEMLSRIKNVEVVGQSCNGKEALDMILDLRPDVALLDINMPGMNGIEVLTTIKTKKPDIKVILFTSFTTPGIQEECIKHGADYFFQSNSIESLIDLLGSMRYVMKT